MSEVRTASSWDARARRKLQSVGAEAFGTHQVEDWPVVCFNPMVLYPQLSTISKVLVLQSIVLLYILAAHWLSRPALIFSLIHSPRENRTQIRLPRKHKYVSPGTAFHIVQYYGEIRTSNGAFPKA